MMFNLPSLLLWVPLLLLNIFGSSLTDPLRQLSAAQQSNNSNDVLQLVSLIQSLVRVDKIQYDNGVDVVSSPPTSNSFEPSYVTPNRNQDNNNDDLKIVCYYSSWAVYRSGLAKFTPQNIDPYLCTHLIYAFGGLSSKFELESGDPYNDLNQGNYKKFVGLKAYNKKLKTLIVIGGLKEGPKRISKLVASPELRNTFINSTLRFLREHNFDGIDLNWQYPGFGDGSSPDDRQNFAQLIKELRIAFDNEKTPPGKDRLLLTVPVPSLQKYIDQGFDVPTISNYADFLNVLSYDYHTALDPETGHHSPLKARPELSRFNESSKLNTEWTINYYLQLGAPRNKLILGIPTYGRSFTLANPDKNGITAPAEGPGESGPSTRAKGYLAFYEICQKMEEEGWSTQRPNPQIEGPYSYKDNQWVAYDDIQSIEQKSRFIVDMGLGGAMVWTIDNDDFRGLCYREQSPLINAVKISLSKNLVKTTTINPIFSYYETPRNDLRNNQNNNNNNNRESNTDPPTTTAIPTTLQSNGYRPQPSRFTNYNTLPPEFDIAPFTTPAYNFFELEHGFTTAKAAPTTTAPTRQPQTQLPPRRNSRPRRPQALPIPVQTTTQRPN